MNEGDSGIGGVVLVSCNGTSARGRVTAMAAKLIRQGFDGVRCVDVVPLLAGMPEEVAALQGARAVVGLSGCDYRCDARACGQVSGRELDEAVIVGDLLRPEVVDVTETNDSELHKVALEVSSRVLGILQRY